MSHSTRFAFIAAFAVASLADASVVTQYTMRNDLPGLISEVRDLGLFVNRDALGGDLTGSRPTYDSIMQGRRVYGSGMANPIVVNFQTDASMIRVFNNIDHPESGYDYYQYSIWGSRDGVNYEQLFDATATEWTGREWRLTGWTGAAPTRVNTVVHSAVSPTGATGYVTDFTFAKSYFYFKFGASTLAINSGNIDQELSGVGYFIPTPAASALLLAAAGLMRRRRA